MENKYIDIPLLLQPLHDIEDIAWKHFGYAFLVVFSFPLIVPIFLIGIIYVEALDDNIHVNSKYLVSFLYTLLFIIYLSVPLISGLLSLSFLVFGYFITGMGLSILATLWLLSYSFIMPGLLVFINQTEGPLAVVHLSKIGQVVREDHTAYLQSFLTLFVASLFLLIAIISLFWIVIGIIAIPLILLWYLYVTSLIHNKIKDKFIEVGS